MLFPGFYQSWIKKGLERAYNRRAEKGLSIEADLETARIIIFSDQHRGLRDGADDFTACEGAYLAALEHYFQAGWRLIVLGDAEDLWECRPGPVVGANRRTLAGETEFHRDGRYCRIFGNHDDLWQHAGPLNRHLRSVYDTAGRKQAPLRVAESLTITLTHAGKRAGELFLLHGHQGALLDDQFGWLSRLVLRYFWRPIQRLTKVRTSTPARDAKLRDRHGIALYEWALGKNRASAKLVLIAGHTHAPVFLSQNHLDRLLLKLRTQQARLARARQAGAPGGEIFLEVEDTRRRIRQRIEKEGGRVSGAFADSPVEERKPCYFNAGCCSFSDGDITGIEIAGGSIRLVKWPARTEKPEPEILETARLAQDVFGAL